MNNRADPGPRYENTTLYFSSRVEAADPATNVSSSCGGSAAAVE